MLAHRLRHWPNLNPTLNERLMFAGQFDTSANPRISKLQIGLSDFAYTKEIVKCSLNLPVLRDAY